MKWVPETTAYDEAFERPAAPRPHYRGLVTTLESFTLDEIDRRERLQKISLVDQGITFTVYGEKDGIERIFPFDFVPRIIPAREWERIEAGLVQRVTALNLFIADVYQEQKCLRDKIIPAELVLSRKEYKRELLRLTPPRQIYTHVVGTDIIRSDRGEYLILEDNCRCPSGVSYVLENRNLLHRVFPEFFTRYPVRPIRDYPRLLLDTLLWSAPRASESPVAVVLTPGIHNSAYFEHSFLAREMGVFLVEGRDLIVEDSYLYMRTTGGRQRVDVIYRRVDEDFLDPLAFRRDSLLGVPGHRFAFGYDAYISESFMELRVQPKSTGDQTVRSFMLAVGPPTRVHRYVDWNDNVTHHFTITRFHDRIEVASRSLVSTHPATPPIAALTDPVPIRDLPYPLLDFLAFGGPVHLTPALRAAHRAAAPPRSAPLGEHVLALGRHLASQFEYRKDVTQYDSTTEHFLELGAGVCQDFAHLMLGLLRLSQVPCRYVSGYLHVERKRREPSQSHAWVEFWAPSHGWIPFDPTHDRAIDERYAVVGHGRHYDDVPPNKGIYRGVAREMLHAEVHTQESAAGAMPPLTSETRPIPLQTFREPPARRPDRPGLQAEDEQQQQQQ